MSEIETLIVGAGLTGLALADALRADGREFRIIDTRDRVGGRAWSPEVGGARYDLGPAWFWPGQPLIAALARRFGLRVFEQYAIGRLVFEDASGAIRRDMEMAPMAGSLRVEGGMGAVAEALAGGVDVGLTRRLTGLRLDADGVVAELQGGDAIRAERIVLAMPPRLIAKSIAVEPSADIAPLAVPPTWMAGHAKLVAIYPTPFWRRAGLSGDAISHRGPLAEIHDASPADGASGALFGFVSAPPDQRADADALKRAAIDQLARLFGDEAAAPIDVLLKDWVADVATATDEDRAPLTAHPAYGPVAQPSGPWAGRLFIASAETAPVHGGYLEGALEAARTMAAALTRAVPPR
ncbi:MAG: NAD(P)/FAD-dependent oxidoreductase [Pseudomonadota bacterium]